MSQTSSQFPSAFDNLQGSYDRMHPSLASVLNSLQQTIGTTSAPQFAPIGGRHTSSFTSNTLAAGAPQEGLIPMATGYRLLHIATNFPGRCRLYTTSASQASDVGRAFGVSPAEGAGCVFDFLSQSPNLMAADLTPAVDGYSMAATPSINIPITVNPTNAGTITVTLTWSKLE